MSMKLALILLTVVSVVCDTLLLPFYPQFFAQSFGLDTPQHVGFYVASCCFTVMLAFPVWARVARHVHELHLWLVTQVAAGALGLACYAADSLVAFWLLSQLMLVFKASYLLIYPFVLRLEEKDKHLGLVGLFTVIMHFGAIGGAVLGGLTLQVFEPRDAYLIMPAGDFLQVLLCAWLIHRHRVHWRPVATGKTTTTRSAGTRRFVVQLGIVSLLVYCSAFLIRPFFAQYWMSVVPGSGEIVAGLVYALPAALALLGLWFNHGRQVQDNRRAVFGALLLGVAGLMLQGLPELPSILLGRALFGWAMFQITVRLEVLLFESSQPQHYGADFSLIHLCQNIGVLIASFSVGIIVAHLGTWTTFALASCGFALTALIFRRLFLTRRRLQAAAPEGA